MTSGARVERLDTLWCGVTGVFHRAVDPRHRERALDGSRLPGRYSTAEQATLYDARDAVAPWPDLVAAGGGPPDDTRPAGS